MEPKVDFFHRLRRKGRDGLVQLPARRIANAMAHGQVAPFLGVQIVGRVGILGKKERSAFFHGAPDALGHARHHRPRLRRAKAAGNKIVLHVHNDQNFPHAIASLRTVLYPKAAALATCPAADGKAV